MILETKNINLNNFKKDISILLTSKNKSTQKVEVKKSLVLNTNLLFFEIYNFSKQIISNYSFNNIILNVSQQKPKNILETVEIIEEEVIDLFSWSYEIPNTNILFSCPVDVTKVVMTHDYMEGYSTGDRIDYTASNNNFFNPIFMDFFKNNIYEFLEDDVPLFYKDENKYREGMGVVRNSNGEAYIPQFNFSGIQVIDKNRGYALKNNIILYFKIKSEKYNTSNISDYNFEYGNGWTYVSYNSLSNIDAIEFFKPYTDNNQLFIVKAYNGKTYLPQYNFNGIGDLKPGESYSVKFQNI